jgi:hypothetical protein
MQVSGGMSLGSKGEGVDFIVRIGGVSLGWFSLVRLTAVTCSSLHQAVAAGGTLSTDWKTPCPTSSRI